MHCANSVCTFWVLSTCGAQTSPTLVLQLSHRMLFGRKCWTAIETICSLPPTSLSASEQNIKVHQAGVLQATSQFIPVVRISGAFVFRNPTPLRPHPLPCWFGHNPQPTASCGSKESGISMYHFHQSTGFDKSASCGHPSRLIGFTGSLETCTFLWKRPV